MEDVLSDAPGSSGTNTQKSIRVLYLIDTLEVGGAERSLLAILQRFRTVQPIMCHIYPGETLKPAYQAAGIPVISLNLPGKYAFPQAILRVRQVIAQQRPDLIHTTLFRADVVGRTAGRLCGVPVVSSFVNEPYHPQRWQRLAKKQKVKLYSIYWLDRLTSRWPTHFVAISETVKQANCRDLHVLPEQVSVIYRGRAPEDFTTESNVPFLYNASNPKGRITLLNVGRLLIRKGQIDLVRAFSLIRQRYPSAHLLIAGDGPDRCQVEAIIQQCGLQHRVHLLGTQLDIPGLLSRADLFAFPSHYEGHGGALVEAMFAARPIVASDIPVHRESIDHGESGLLVPVGDPAALAQALAWMLDHPEEAREMGRRARAVALERFHIDRIAAQHEALYARVLADWRARRSP